MIGRCVCCAVPGNGRRSSRLTGSPATPQVLFHAKHFFCFTPTKPMELSEMFSCLQGHETSTGEDRGQVQFTPFIRATEPCGSSEHFQTYGQWLGWLSGMHMGGA